MSRWTVAVPGDAQLIGFDDDLVVLDAGDELIALEAGDGRVRWRVRPGRDPNDWADDEELAPSHALVDAEFVVGIGQLYLTCYDTVGGSIRWSATTDWVDDPYPDVVMSTSDTVVALQAAWYAPREFIVAYAFDAASGDRLGVVTDYLADAADLPAVVRAARPMRSGGLVVLTLRDETSLPRRIWSAGSAHWPSSQPDGRWSVTVEHDAAGGRVAALSERGDVSS
jgi:hypothetical protein